jgi:hypothetical protein
MSARCPLLLLAASLAACSGGPATCTLHEIQPVALFAVISSSGLSPALGVPTIAFTAPALNGADELDAAVTDEMIELTFSDPAQTGATCVATSIAQALEKTDMGIRDGVNLLTPTNTFSLSCTGVGAWANAQVTLRATGVTVPLAAATSFTLALDFEVDLAGSSVELSGTQAFGVVDVVVPGSC